MAPDRRLTLREWGDDGGPRVVCWPGLNLPAHAHFDEAGPMLAERFGLHVRAVEPPGWTSPPLGPEGYLPTELARLVVPMLAPRSHFLGWSWGATIGVHLGALSPESLAGLVLLDAGFTDMQDDLGFSEPSLAELRAEFGAAPARFDSWDAYLAAARERVRTWRPALEARARSAMREDDGSIVPLVAPETLAAGLYGVAVEPPSRALPEIRCPVLLVTAGETLERFGRGPLERFRAAVPHGEVVTVDSGHDLLADARDETIAAVGDFVARWS